MTWQWYCVNANGYVPLMQPYFLFIIIIMLLLFTSTQIIRPFPSCLTGLHFDYMLTSECGFQPYDQDDLESDILITSRHLQA